MQELELVDQMENLLNEMGKLHREFIRIRKELDTAIKRYHETRNQLTLWDIDENENSVIV